MRKIVLLAAILVVLLITLGACFGIHGVDPTPEYPAESAPIVALLVPQHNTLCVRDELFSAAIMPDGALWRWETPDYLYPGSGGVPVQAGTDTDWVGVAIGFSIVALKSDGSLWTWDMGEYWESWELYLKGYVEAFEFPPLDHIFSTPIQVGTSTEWVSISAGQLHIVAIKPVGGHMCMYYGNSHGGTPRMNEMARVAYRIANGLS